jgi:precorrin-8X/cobalt-precorrin-8 methylmutase
MLDYLRDPAEITRRSFEIIAAEANLSALPADIAPVAARIVHASGMPDIVGDLAFSDGAGRAGSGALKAGAPILCDVRMVAAGIAAKHLPKGNEVHVALDAEGAQALAVRSGQTRSAAGMEAMRDRFGGAIVVIGNAPTALFRLLELVADGAAKPALVLGFPVGFVGAAESKDALVAAAPAPFVTVRGRLGGSAVTAAAINALAREERP